MDKKTAPITPKPENRPAEPPVKADGPGKKILMVAGIIGGFLAGFFLGAAFAILALISAKRSSTVIGHLSIRPLPRASGAECKARKA